MIDRYAQTDKARYKTKMFYEILKRLLRFSNNNNNKASYNVFFYFVMEKVGNLVKILLKYINFTIETWKINSKKDKD